MRLAEACGEWDWIGLRQKMPTEVMAGWLAYDDLIGIGSGRDENMAKLIIGHLKPSNEPGFYVLPDEIPGFPQFSKPPVQPMSEDETRRFLMGLR